MKVRKRGTYWNPPKTTTTLRCISCGAKKDILAERAFKCTACGDLLEVHHDYQDMSAENVEKHKDIFRSRGQRYGIPYGGDIRSQSGVWCFHELVMPNLAPAQLITLGEGIVPIVPAGKHLREYFGTDEIDAWMILEGNGPTGSFKDFGGAAMISIAKAAGAPYVMCVSTGDTSAMLAAYCAAAELGCCVLLPEGKITAVQLLQPGAYGARVITMPTDFDGLMRVFRELVALGVYPGNSLNPARIEGHKATVFLIAQFFRWNLPEWIAVPVGNGSNSSSVGKGLRQLKDLGFVRKTSRILGCQSESANPLALSWASAQGSSDPDPLRAWRHEYQPVTAGETLATATRIGDPVSREKVMREIIASNGSMQSVSERELAEGMHAAARDGYLVCPQSGIAISGVKRAIARGDIRKGESVVIVSTATGMKFASAYESNALKRVERAADAETSTIARMLGI